MPTKYLTCELCGRETPFGTRARIIWQEDCDSVNYWRNRPYLNTGRILHVCRGCADRLWGALVMSGVPSASEGVTSWNLTSGTSEGGTSSGR